MLPRRALISVPALSMGGFSLGSSVGRSFWETCAAAIDAAVCGVCGEEWVLQERSEEEQRALRRGTRGEAVVEVGSAVHEFFRQLGSVAAKVCVRRKNR